MMKVIETRADLRTWSDGERAAGRRVALVPTMGALHAGHLSLVKEARRAADRVCVSIFVNPTQFNDAADFEAYPNTREADIWMVDSAGADAVVFPRADELYPDGIPERVDPVDYGARE